MKIKIFNNIKNEFKRLSIMSDEVYYSFFIKIYITIYLFGTIIAIVLGAILNIEIFMGIGLLICFIPIIINCILVFYDGRIILFHFILFSRVINGVWAKILSIFSAITLSAFLISAIISEYISK